MAIKDKIISILADYLELDKSQILPTSNLGDLGADSLDTIEIILTMERELNIKLPDKISVETVQDLIDCIGHIIVEPDEGFSSFL